MSDVEVYERAAVPWVESPVGDVYVLVPGYATPLRLAETARVLWDLCETGASLDEVADAVGAGDGAPDPALRTHIGDRLRELVANGVLATGHTDEIQ